MDFWNEPFPGNREFDKKV